SDVADRDGRGGEGCREGRDQRGELAREAPLEMAHLGQPHELDARLIGEFFVEEGDQIVDAPALIGATRAIIAPRLVRADAEGGHEVVAQARARADLVFYERLD